MCTDFDFLLKTPGPIRCIANVGPRDEELWPGFEFEITSAIRQITGRMNEKDETNIKLIPHNGNLLLVEGLGENPQLDDIIKIPVALGAHLDEITYMVKKGKTARKVKSLHKLDYWLTGKEDSTEKEVWELIPLCNPPHVLIPGEPIIIHPEVKVLGFRHNSLVVLGVGRIEAEPNPTPQEPGAIRYLLDTDAEVRVGDLVIQAYGPWWNNKNSVGAIVTSKAIDDRAGSLVTLNVLREMHKIGVPAKAILVGDEEGVPRDESWGRNARRTFEKFCDYQNSILIVDGIDGRNLTDFKSLKGHIPYALLPPYTSSGVGAGDPRLFARLRDEVATRAKLSGFRAEPTTNYVSRSFDNKLRDSFPRITCIDWSCGVAGDPGAICHRHESILIEQLINLIGFSVFATLSLQ